MRVSREEMDRNHERIVEGASRLVRERGIEQPSVADFMKEAGLTHGGFYRHFDTKDALVVAALEAAFGEFNSALEDRLDREGVAAGAIRFQADYLSDTHVGNPSSGCPLAALGGDVSRGPKALRAAFGAGFGRAVSALARAMKGSPEEKQERAMRRFAMLVGAVVIARASDPQTAGAVLKACREVSGKN